MSDISLKRTRHAKTEENNMDRTGLLTMFNGYNETPLISYNEFNQDRVEKKQENVPKWSYGHDVGVQSAQSHPNNRHSEFWSGKSNFLGLPNVVKCNCTSCYPSSENQSYQGDTSRHRPWLPRAFPVFLNNSGESCKLPSYQWDNGLSSQSSCSSESSFPHVQENGGKYPYYRHYQNSRLPEPNQPGVITSLKDAEYVKRQKNEISSRTLESPIQNGTIQPMFCNPAYNLTKRTNGRNYCDPNDKYSNLASYSVDQHISRLPVVEPFIKAVPSNLSQNRVPSTGYRSVKENIPQPYIDSGFGDARKVCTESTINNDKRNEAFSTGQLHSGAQADHSHLKRDLHEEEPQKLFFDNSRHPDYFPRNSIQDAIKRNNQILDNRKDFAINQISQIGIPEQHYTMPRSKYQEIENPKSSYEAFYSEEFEKIKPENHLFENPACFQRIEDTKSENTNIHARLPRSALLFNGPRFDDTQNSFSYQSDPISYRNHLRPEYSYQNFNSQVRFEHPAGFQRNDFNQYRVTPQQMQSNEQFSTQQNSGFFYNLHCQQNSDKTQQFCGEKNPSSFQADFQAEENKKINYLEAIRSEEIKKNGTSKISPLRLLRKKKFINVPHESTPASTLDSAPGLDVRKFWSTWAEEEEENQPPSQMVVLDCQNIDLEQAKLLNLYETDPVRAVHFESGNIVIKGSNCTKDSTSQAVQFEQIKTYEELVASESKTDEQKTSENEKSAVQQKDTEEAKDRNSILVPETENKSATVESACPLPKPCKKARSEHENRSKKKSKTMDKWTEKKFDFLKRAEESKAAEILRHEEEKKKIFETRQSIQQSLKKTEKQEKNIIEGDENVLERISSFDDKLEIDLPQDGSSSTINLPTSEYRRNKFLDYSDRKIMLNSKGKVERNVTVGANSYVPNEPNEKIKKEEIVKLECSDKRPEKHPAETLFPSLNTKFKEETDVEMDDILKKISDINFQSSEIKIEDEIKNNIAKKPRLLVKKTKKKKSDHQTESDERKDEVTVETVSKPTIKFSIQKSHDLKISFKVLNSNKEYSDVDVRGEDIETKGNATEDSKNSTELITLKYKSIQRESDKRQSSDFIRNKRGFRRKKRALEKKTPVLKIKKSRYLPEEERDSLADDYECLNTSKKSYSDEYATSEDFQVQETVDSAKIKLTFKRHKGNFETEYKINSNDIEKISAPEFDQIREDLDQHMEKTKSKKKSRRAKKKELFAETADTESFKNNSGPSSDIKSDSENPETQLESVLEEDSRNSSTSLDSCIEKENFNIKPKVLIFSEFPLDYDKFMFSGERKKCDVIEDFKLIGETNKYDQEQVEFTEAHVINCYEDNRGESFLSNCSPSPDVNLKELTVIETLSVEKNQEEAKDCKKEEIQEISVDFIKSTKSPEIVTENLSGKTEETEIVLNADNNMEGLKEESSNLESCSEIKHSDNLENSYESKCEKNEEKTFASKNLKIIEDLCDWKSDSLGNDDADKLNENLFDNIKNRSKNLEKISSSFLSTFELENENFGKNFVSPEKNEAVIKITKTDEVLLPSEKTTEPYPVKECMNDFKVNCENNNSLQPELDKSTTFDLELGGAHLESSIKDFVKNDITCKVSPLIEKSRIFSTSGTSPKGICIPVAENKNLGDEPEKLNKDTNNCNKSPNLPHLEPEEVDRSNFELSLKSGENITECDLECITPSTLRTPEVIASVIVRSPNKIHENLTFEFSPENNFSECLDSSVTECHKVYNSPSLRSSAKNPDVIFKKAKLSSVNVTDSNGDAHLEADGNGNREVSEVGEYRFPSLGKTMNSETTLKGTNDLSIDIIQSDKLTIKDPDDNHDDHSAQAIDLSQFQEIIKSRENLHFSPKTDDSEQLPEKVLRNVSSCTTPSDSNQNVRFNSVGQNFINEIKPDLPSLSDVELEDGEIIDSSDELHESSLDRKQIVNAMCNECTDLNKTQRKQLNFISRNIKRRHSMKSETLRKKKESPNLKRETWSVKEFSRAKSCPPELKFSEELLHKTEEALNIVIEDIPLPVGPPPYSSCLNLKKYLSFRAQINLVYSEAKEKPEKSIALEQPQIHLKETLPSDPPVGLSNFQNSLNPLEILPVLEKDESHLGIFQRTSKIKFSFSKRSRFSKIGLKDVKKSQFEMSSQASVSKSKVHEIPEKKKIKNPDFKNNKKMQTRDSVSTDKNSTLNECQIEKVPKEIFTGKIEEMKNRSDSEEIKKPRKDLEQPVALLCEDLDEKVEVDALSDFITDEFYECEDIPTSEDLTNGDDLENEKVNDDKFRNIMQNCLDNAKKFLNVGNLKLFSCSVDDLLELDCQASESALGESEPEKPTNHISRDVLLTSCEDTSDDLGLSENVPPPDISMDFVPSFCSDVCSEILPVDNWPYLEEEVPSSPTKLKQDETDLIPYLENTSLNIASESCLQFCPKNGIERSVRKQVVSENLKGFRRRSLITGDDGLKICSKIDGQRRKTIESFSGESCGRDICDIKNKLVKLNNETNEIEKRSLKCRLSLEKLTNKHQINFELKNEKMKRENKIEKKSLKSLNYKSPSWQPRVMLFRISKTDLKKVVKSSDTYKLSKSRNSGNSPKKEISADTDDEDEDDKFAVKKQKFTSDFENEERKVNGGKLSREKLGNLPRLDSIKGSLTAVTSIDTDIKRNKKSRFRNLHSKRKIAPIMSKDENSFVQNIQFAEPTLVHAETVLIKMCKDCNRSSNSLVKNTKEVICAKNSDEKLKRKLSEIKLSATENNQNANSKSEERLQTSCSRGKSREDLKEDKHCEKAKKSHNHRDKKSEKGKEKEQRIQNRHREGESKKHNKHSRSRHLWRSSGANSEPEPCKRERCRSANARDEKKWKSQQKTSLENPWICEVCGFDDVSERVVHIKSHPFHCQSCHLAFKTETHFISHLTKKHKDIRNQHHCLLCELSFDTQEQYHKHLETREHRHLESVEKNTINTLFTLLTGAPCPVLGLVEMKPEWLPNQAGTVHFYHQATPLSLALQFLNDCFMGPEVHLTFLQTNY